MRHALLAVLLLLTTLTVAGTPSATTPLAPIFEPYEAIRLALLDDTTNGVDAAASDLLAATRALDASTLDLEDGATIDLDELLPEIVTAAEILDTARGLGPVRDAYYELSKLLVRLRSSLAVDAADSDIPAVAYCPMVKKSWLQPADEAIGNPYAGQTMPRCGDLIASNR